MALPNKIPLQWIYKANTKGPMSETRGPMIGGAVHGPEVSLARFICLDWAQ